MALITRRLFLSTSISQIKINLYIHRSLTAWDITIPTSTLHPKINETKIAPTSPSYHPIPPPSTQRFSQHPLPSELDLARGLGGVEAALGSADAVAAAVAGVEHFEFVLVGGEGAGAVVREVDACCPPLAYLCLQDHARVCWGERGRGRKRLPNVSGHRYLSQCIRSQCVW